MVMCCVDAVITIKFKDYISNPLFQKYSRCVLVSMHPSVHSTHTLGKHTELV